MSHGEASPEDGTDTCLWSQHAGCTGAGTAQLPLPWPWPCPAPGGLGYPALLQQHLRQTPPGRREAPGQPSSGSLAVQGGWGLGGSHCTVGWDMRPLSGLSWGQAHWGSALCQQVCAGSRGRGRHRMVHETGRALLGPGAGSCMCWSPPGPRCCLGLGHVPAGGSQAPPSEATGHLDQAQGPSQQTLAQGTPHPPSLADAESSTLTMPSTSAEWDFQRAAPVQGSWDHFDVPLWALVPGAPAVK